MDKSIAHWLSEYISQAVDIAPAQVDTAARFDEYGLGSLKVAEMSGALSRRLGRDVDLDLFYDYPSIDSLSAHLLMEIKEK